MQESTENPRNSISKRIKTAMPKFKTYNEIDGDITCGIQYVRRNSDPLEFFRSAVAMTDRLEELVEDEEIEDILIFEVTNVKHAVLSYQLESPE